MTDQTAPAPRWLDGFVDILQARRRTWIVTAVAVVLLGALLALLAPSLLPPTLLMGVAVGIAAALLATATVVALDSADLVVRGPRHVVAAGGQVAGTISRSPGDIDALMDLIDQYGSDRGVRVALTPASRSAGVPGARANMVAEELAQRDLKVLCTDLTRGRTPAVGLSDVLSGDRKLAEAVRFDEELFLAHLAIGSEPEAALAGFADWANALPEDLDVLVAALPPLAEPGVLPAVQGVELVLVLVEVDRTERVDLIACLDAIDAAGVPAALVLVDPDLDTTASPSSSVAVIGQPAETDTPDDSWAEPEPVVPIPAPEGSPGTAADRGAATGERDDVLPADVHMDTEGDDWDEPVRVVGTDPAPLQRVDVVAAPDRTQRSDGGDAGGGRSTPVAGSVTTAPGAAAAAAGAAAAGAAGAKAADSVAHGHVEDRPDEYEDEDDAAPPVPGGGHVRTVRPRRPAEDPAGSVPSPSSTATPDAAASREPDVAAPAPPEPAAAAGTTDSKASIPADRPVDDDDDDDIDATARETARLTASLQSLANEVWQRGDE